MQEAQTWRELLATIVRDNKEKQRLIEELHVTPITLTRWMNGDSEPRPQNLRHLMNALPQYREQFRALLKDEKGLRDVVNLTADEEVKEIPTEFYANVLTARATTNATLRFWSTCHLILQQALGQLDPDHLGMSLWVARCMPPSGPYQKVRSLRESVGLGTGPWAGNLEQHAMFLGAESLAGNVVTLGRPGIIPDIEKEPPITPYTLVEHEKSAAIYPILYAGRIAGVLLVSSAQKNYFLSQAHTDLVQRYADLVALAFDPPNFYPPEQIALCVMPSSDDQRAYFAKFRQLVADTMRQAAHRNRPVNNVQADMLVWQQLEDDLLKLPALKGSP
jgi:hypothetical protein